jgi:hypothetical protein
MKRLRLALTSILLMTGLTVFGQLNSYRYIVVPKQFQAFKEQNQHHSSTLVNYLLKEAGFTTYYEGEVPESLAGSCEGLRIALIDESGMLSTKVKFAFEDCRGNEVYRTFEGSSREKELKNGYKEAIEEAFKSVSNLNYQYEPKEKTADAVVLNFDGDVKKHEEVGDGTKVVKNKPPDRTVLSETSPEQQKHQARTPQPSDYIKANEPEDPTLPGEAAINSPQPWFAQPIPNGFQLVDLTPAIRLRLYTLSRPDVFIAENDEVHGVLYSQDDHWFFEFYKNGKRVVQELDIRF